MQKVYFSCAETAKMVRASLKKTFPKTKFGVRSKVYAGGASISVDWMDGPAEKLVESVVGAYAGGRFDGSIDMAYSVSHWLLADGSVTIASDPGTGDQRGSHQATRNWMPEPDAKLVHFGANYIFTKRDISPALMNRVLDRLAARGLPVEAGKVNISTYDGTAHYEVISYDPEVTRGFDMQREVWRAVSRTHCAA